MPKKTTGVYPSLSLAPNNDLNVMVLRCSACFRYHKTGHIQNQWELIIESCKETKEILQDEIGEVEKRDKIEEEGIHTSSNTKMHGRKMERRGAESVT